MRSKSIIATLVGISVLVSSVSYAKLKYEGITLRCLLVGGGAYEFLYNERIPLFEKETGARVDSSSRLTHHELNKKLNLEFATGRSRYDVVSNHDEYQAQWRDFLQPLDDYITSEMEKDLLPRILNASRVDGKLIAIPRHVDVRLMYYRTDLFNDPKEKAAFREKYGYELHSPKNWNELRDVATFFTRPPELYGFVFTGRDVALSITFVELLRAAGGDLVDANMKPIFNNSAGVEALTFLVDLYRVWKVTPEGVPTYEWDEVAKLFREGKIAFHFDWPGWYGLAKDPKESKVADKFDFAPYPAGPSGKLVAGGGSHTFAMTKASKHKDAAWDLIEFLTSPESMYYEAKKGGFLPVQRSVLEKTKEDAARSDDPRDLHRLQILEDELENYFAHNCIEIPEWPQISDNLYHELQRALLGEKTPQQALDDAVEFTHHLLSEAGYYK